MRSYLARTQQEMPTVSERGGGDCGFNYHSVRSEIDINSIYNVHIFFSLNRLKNFSTICSNERKKCPIMSGLDSRGFVTYH